MAEQLLGSTPFNLSLFSGRDRFTFYYCR